MPEKTTKDLIAENAELRVQLEEVKETLNAIRRGEVDGLVVSTPKGEQIYTLTGAETPYRLLIEEMKEGALMLSDDNLILYANKGFAKIVKHPLVEIVGKNIENIIDHSHLSTFKEILFISRARKVVVENQIALKAKDNSLIPVHISVALLTKNDPKTTLLIATDLTQHMEEQLENYTTNLEKEIKERKKAEEALLRAKAQLEFDRKRLETIFETSPAAVVVLEAPSGKISFINKRAMQLYGFNSVGLDLDAAISKVKPKRADGSPYPLESGPTRRALNGYEITNEEMIIERADGTIFPILTSASPVRDDRGKVTSVIVIFQDITERKQAEEKLEEYRNNLERLVEERTRQLKDSERLATIGATAGMVGHGIRNPLQAITSDVYLAKTELASIPDSEEKKNALESIEEIEKNVEYINKIVQDLQDYSRPLNPKKEQSNLKQIIESLVAKNGLAKNVYLNVKVPENIREIMVDPYYLNRILSNLITNAVQAMPKGGKLTIEARKEASDIIIIVEDTGVGIPKKIQEKMFTLMFTTKAKGQGFGLPVVKRMTESLGGTVSFESQEGKGTTFKVRLPSS